MMRLIKLLKELTHHCDNNGEKIKSFVSVTLIWLVATCMLMNTLL